MPSSVHLNQYRFSDVIINKYLISYFEQFSRENNLKVKVSHTNCVGKLLMVLMLTIGTEHD